MMKKILIVGELNQIMGSLNKHLSTKFQTQMCVDNLEMVKSMRKVFMPDMVLMSLVGGNEMDNRIVDYLCDRSPQMPILFLGTVEECDFYQKKYDSDKFEFVARPTTLGMLLHRCEMALKISETNEAEGQGGAVSLEGDGQSKKCILAVDDSGIFLRSLKTMLEKDYDIVVANSGEAAINQAKKKSPDLILLDYEMPGWDGKKTFEEIRNDETLKDIPVVFLTAVSDKKHIAAVLALRPAGYLLKPIDQQRLFDTIEEALIEI